MNKIEGFVVKSKKYELVPPDGGWGYMIWIAAIINYTTTTMFLGSFSIIYNELLEELDMGSTSVTFLNGINTICLAVAAFFTNSLLKVMGIRKLSILASLLFNLGNFCVIFVASITPLFICQGLLQGFGFGILYNLSCTLINDYFLKKRLLSISVTQMAAVVINMTAPLLVRWSLARYGFRGTQMLISGISLHTFVAVALIQPVSWHMRKIEVPGEHSDEMKLLMVNDKVPNNSKPLTTPIITLTDAEKSIDSKVVITTLHNTQKIYSNNRFRLILNKIIDVVLLKKFLLSAAAMGPAYCVFAEFLFILMLPQALYSMGWKEDIVAKAISLNALGDLIARTSFIFLSKWIRNIGSQEIYLAGLVIALLSRLGMLWSHNVMIVMIFLTIMGVSRCFVTVFPQLILADIFSPDEFTSVIGIYMMVVGLMHLIIGPGIGAVRDLTESYPTVFYIITSCIGVVILLWSIELCYKRNKHKRIKRDVTLRAKRNINIKK